MFYPVAILLAFAVSSFSEEISSTTRSIYYGQSNTAVVQEEQLVDEHQGDDVLLAESKTVKVTPYDQLLQWFKLGTPITFAQFKGFYSGRCYRPNKKSKAENSLIGYEIDSNDDGPAFGEKFRVLDVFHGNGVPADYYDNEKIFQSEKKVFLKVLASMHDNYSLVSEQPTLSYTYDWEANNRNDSLIEIVEYNGYFLQKSTALIAQRYPLSGFLNPGEASYICYYFKKLAD